MRGPQSITGVTLTQTVALALPCAVVASANPSVFAAQVATALIVALGWEALFAAIRRRLFGVHGMTTALIVTVVIPADLPLWQLVLVLSLGVTLGELIFGGRGFGFVQPATIAASLLVFSFPQVQLAPPSQALALATVPGGALLLLMGLISWRVILSTFVGVAGYLALTGQAVDPMAIITAAAFGTVFLVSDPTSAAATNPGRWVYGLLTGGLIALFSGAAMPTTQAIVFAALLASVFAPLIDHLVVLAHARRRGLLHA